MKKILVSGALIMFSLLQLKAQSNIKASDMLLFSQTNTWGTARSAGMAGSFGALGGDMISLSTNPAGIGVYRSSELSFTPSFNYNNSHSKFYGRTDEDFSEKFNFGNVGYVYTYNSNKDYGWVSASFGVAYNRLNDFNRNVVMKTQSATSSLLDEFVYYANGGNSGIPESPNNLYPFYEGLGWETYAVDTGFFGGGYYHSPYTLTDNVYGQQQARQRTIKGGISEYSFTFGANYSHQFYLGATLGIQRLKYEEESVHSEDDINGTADNLTWFDFIETFKYYGTGLNFKGGIIYKPIDLLRLGFAVHSPTFYTINSEFYTFMETQYDTAFIPNYEGTGYDDYAYGTTYVREAKNTLRTPWKFITSVGVQFGKFGVVNVDWEHLNYSNMRLSGDLVDYQNDDVKDFYKSGNNIRVGAELKLDNFALRGGYGYSTSPYKNSSIDITYQTYSAGIGYRGKSVYIDFAYNLLQYTDAYSLYTWTERYNTGTNTTEVTDEYPVIADLDFKVNRFVLTVGFKF